MSTPQQEDEEKVEHENGKSDGSNVLRQRKIMSSAKETIESGKICSSDSFYVYAILVCLSAPFLFSSICNSKQNSRAMFLRNPESTPK